MAATTKSRKYKWGRLWINADMSQATSRIRYSTDGPNDLDYSVFQVADARHSWPKAFTLVNSWLKGQGNPKKKRKPSKAKKQMKRAGKALAAWARAGMPAQRNAKSAWWTWKVYAGDPGFGNSYVGNVEAKTKAEAQRLARDAYGQAPHGPGRSMIRQTIYVEKSAGQGAGRSVRNAGGKAKKANPRKKSQPKLTLAQGRKLYELGRRAPKTAVAIKKNGATCSIVTGKAAKKLKGR